MDRTKGIGSSDVPVIMGTVGSLATLYLQKIGELKPEETEVMRWGTVLEDVVAEEWSRRNGVPIRKPDAVPIQGPEDWIFASPDFFTEDGRILEIKTTSIWNIRKYSYQIPESYYYQVLWQMGVTGHRKAVVAALALDERRLYDWEVVFNEDDYQRIYQAARTFWFDHVLKRIPPPSLDGEQPVAGSSALATEEILQLIESYVALGREIAQLEEERELLKKGILAAMGRAETLVTRSGMIVARKSIVTTRRLDTRALQQAHPDIYEAFTQTTTYTRLTIPDLTP